MSYIKVIRLDYYTKVSFTDRSVVSGSQEISIGE